jgi:hypothetical protein
MRLFFPRWFFVSTEPSAAKIMLQRGNGFVGAADARSVA